MHKTHQQSSPSTSGAKYLKLVKRHQDAAHLKSLEPLLMQSINYSDKLFCALTCQLLTATADAAATHMQGKKFTRHKGTHVLERSLSIHLQPLRRHSYV